MRKHTLVIQGAQVGAVLALAIADNVGLGADKRQYAIRRDGHAQVWAFAPEDDKGARGRWARECKATGLTVLPAPWERKGAA